MPLELWELIALVIQSMPPQLKLHPPTRCRAATLHRLTAIRHYSAELSWDPSKGRASSVFFLIRMS